jgi:hypothetical protein
MLSKPNFAKPEFTKPTFTKPKVKFGLTRWASVKLMWTLITIELPLTVALLVLFGVADPDTYRTLLWLDGFENGYNSNPSQPVFNLVNGGKYKEPLVWSQL